MAPFGAHVGAEPCRLPARRYITASNADARARFQATVLLSGRRYRGLQSEIARAVVDFQFPDGAEGCTFEITIAWGEPGAHGWAQLSGHPGDVAHAASHTYTSFATYSIEVSRTATPSRCEVENSSYRFTLLATS